MTGKTIVEYGFHRVLEPAGVVPQAAWRVDARPELLRPTEILLRVSLLNLDSTGMANLKQSGRDIGGQVQGIVRQRGKMHNPNTNSGGVLVGTVLEVGEAARDDFEPDVGEAVIPLVSTSAIPMQLERVGAVSGTQLAVEGTAVLFGGMAYTLTPPDIPLPLALSLLDISSIVPQVYRHVRAGQTVLVIGAGRSGAAGMAAVRKAAGDARILVLDPDRGRLQRLLGLGLADGVIEADARNSRQVLERVAAESDGRLCDLVLNCVNVADTEATSILCARQHGTVVFYSMATRFDRAALGTDATDNDVRLIIGNGIAGDQARDTLALFRESTGLRDYFEFCEALDVQA